MIEFLTPMNVEIANASADGPLIHVLLMASGYVSFYLVKWLSEIASVARGEGMAI